MPSVKSEAPFCCLDHAHRAFRFGRLKFSCTEGDHLTLLNVYTAFVQRGADKSWCGRHFLNFRSLTRATEIRRQLVKYVRRFGVRLVSCGDDSEAIRRCIVSGFFANAARLDQMGVYRTIRKEDPLAVHPSSVLYTEEKPRYVVYNEVVLTSQNYMRDITEIEPEWLAELAPHYYEYKALLCENAKRPRID